MTNQEELLDYIRKAKNGDETAKSVILQSNTPLIKSIIRRFMNKGVESEDLFQIACIGFLKSIKNFDESFGVKFSTYTVPMIIGEIKRYIRDNGAVKVSRSLKILANKINKYVDEYQSQNSDPPSIENIANKFSISDEEVVMAMDSAKMPISLFDKFDEDDDGQELIEKLPSNNEEEIAINKIHISTLIEKLNDREKKLIILRYFRDKTQSEVAESLGVSQVQVSRLESKIIEKMRLKY